MYRFEVARQRHIREYGSFLHCPKTGQLCSFMEATWETGRACSRRPCILKDPEYIALKKKQEENRKKRETEERRRRQAGQEETPAPIRRQTKTWRQFQIEKILRLERESSRAYRRNKPRIGEEKLNQAIMLRRELYRKEQRDV